MPKIKITKHTQTRITDRLKILFGKSIIIGKVYDCCICQVRYPCRRSTRGT